ncbi:MAG: glycoside hydrolase family 5 protein [Butyrivibrio sp.]|nr:glycoside hydrolase family 5 protein [Butyrivibrio sp.]
MTNGKRTKALLNLTAIVLLIIVGVVTCTIGFNSKKEYGDTDAMEFVKNLRSGINIGNSLDCYSSHKLESIAEYETYWGNPVISDSLLEVIKEAGFVSVRIPVTWDQHLLDDGITIDPEWMSRVKEVVDYAYSRKLYVILNTHHEKWHSTSNLEQTNAFKMTEVIWKQIADEFAEYDNHLIFEGFNEPRNIGGNNEWTVGTDEEFVIINRFNEIFVDTVRKTGGNNKNRYLLISTYLNSPEQSALNAVKLPDDLHIILSVHLYTPYVFTGNDNEASKDVKKWDRSSENTRTLDWHISNISDFISRTKVPVIITEMGASYKDNEDSRVAWTQYVTEKLRLIGVPYFWWDDYYSEDKKSYGIIDRRKNVVAYKDIVEILNK